MRNIYTNCVKLVVFAFLFLSSQVSFSQGFTVTGCSGTLGSNLYGPMYSTATANSTSRTAVIYPSSQLSTLSGMSITNIYLHRFTTTGSMAGTPNFKIYLKEVSAADWGSGSLTWDVSGATLVYDGNPASIVGSADGWKNFPLTTTFAYSGAQNLAVYFQYTNATASTAITWTYEYTSPCVNTSNSNTTKYTNNTTGTLPATLGSSNYRRPYIGFDYTAGPCDPLSVNPGDATVAPSSMMCSGVNFTLDLINHTTGSGQTYIWQKSSSLGGPYTDISTSSGTSSFTTNNTVTAYYRAAVTCGATTLYSTPVQVIVPTALPGNTYTINNALPTGGTNFTSFTDAVNAIKCGIAGPVNFWVEPGSGPYTEQITIPQIAGASSTNTVRFLGNGATIQFAPVTANKHIIKLDGADYITLDSLNIVSTATDFGMGVHLANGANYDSITSCTIDMSAVTSTDADNSGGIVSTNSTTDAQAAGNASNLVILNNIIKGGYQGIILNGGTGAIDATANTIKGNTIQDFYSIGIELADTDGAEVSNNDIHRATRTVVTTFEGIEMNSGTKNSMILANRIHDTHTSATTQTSAAYGIFSSSNDAAVGSENKVINNVIYNFNSGSGIQYGLYNSGSNGVFYYHNTIVLDHNVTSDDNTRGFYQTTLATGIQFRNNIVYISRTGTGEKHALYFATATSEIISNNNVLYNIGTGGTVNAIGYHNAITYNDLAAWKTANSNAYDQQSISEDPVFIGSGDFTPSNPTLNGIGANLGITTDINGTPRSASPDPGAYEFTVAGLDADISWVSPVMPVTAGLKTITVSITNSQTSTINSVNLSYTDGTIVQSQTFTGLGLTSGNTQQLSFTTQYNLAHSVRMRAWINTVNGATDNNQVNDTTALQNLCVPLSGYYTINKNAAASSMNFQSLNEAVTQLICSGVGGPVVMEVITGSGPYNEQVTIPSITGASAANNIRFLGNGETITFDPVTGARHIFKLDGADHITIDSFNILITGTDYGWGVHLLNGANNDSIRACTIDMSSITSVTTDNSAGVVGANSTSDLNAAGNANNNVIVNNTIKGGYYGVILNGTATTAADASNNKIKGNTIQDFYSIGIELADTDGTEISNNNIHRANRVTVGTFEGIELNGATKNSLVIANRIHDTHSNATDQDGTSYGIFSSANDVAVGSENKVINNVIYNFNSGTGIQYALYNSSSNGVFYYHNTIVLDNAASTAGTTRGLYQTTLSTGIEVKNNLFYITRGGTGTKHALYFGTTTSTIVSNNNAFYVNATGSTVGVGSYGTTNFATLADWKTANGGAYDQQSVSADPLFVNASAGDFTPTAQSLNNTGANVGVTTDIIGNPRGTSPDPGAYEFTPPPDVIPPAITYTRLTNTISPTGTRTLDVTITDYSGVQQGVNGPRLYYRKSTDPTYLVVSNPTINGSTYTFTLDMNALTGVTTGTVIQYYIAAQDSLGNIGTAPSGGSGATPPGTTAPATPDSFKVVPTISGVFTVGTGGNYLNLTAIANLLNNMEVGIGGDVTFELTNNYDGTTGEVLPITFNQYLTGNPAYTVTIRPAAGVTGRITSGDAGTGTGNAVINLNGTDRIIFDGRPGGVGSTNEWTITNTRSAATIGAVIRLINDATYNTIRNLNIESQATSTATGAIFLSNTSGTLGNSNNSFIANHIRGISGSRISNGIYSDGDAVALNKDNTITANHIYNFANNGINITATGNGPNWTISNNHIYNAIAGTVAQTGITIASATTTNTTISGNFIGGSSDNATGTWTNSGSVTIHPISVTGGTVSILNNTISNISGTGTGTGARIRGINLTSSNDNSVIQGNTISFLSTMSGNTGYAGDGAGAVGIYYFPGGFHNITVTGNLVHDISIENTTALTTSSVAAGMMLTNMGGTVSKNTIYNIRNRRTSTTAGQPPIAAGLYMRFFDGVADNNMISLGFNETDDVQYTGILVAGGTVGNSTSMEFYYNSILIDGSGNGMHSSYALLRGDNTTTSPAHSVDARNNILVNRRMGGTGGHYAVGNMGTAASAGWLTNYNDLHSSDPLMAGYWNATSYDFAGWKTISSQDANSVTIAPVFVSETNLHLVTDANCALINKGTPITGITTDIDGTTRNATTPDIGADEFDNNFTLVVTNPPATCQGSTVNLTAATVTTGSSTGGAFSYWTDAAGTTALSNPAAVATSGTYYIRLIKGSCSDIQPVTVTINAPASTAAGASGTTECATKTISGSTEFNFTDCDLIAVIAPSGGSPISGSVQSCVTIDATVQTASTGEAYVQRHYNITPASNPSTATSTITLYFLQSEFDAFNAANTFYPDLPANGTDAAGKANLRITQYNGTGTAPGNYTGSAVQINPADAGIVWNATLSRWEITFDATGSGGFYVHTGNFVLPVTGLELKGVQSGASNKLSWSTLTETNNRGFEVQRSADGVNFSGLAFIASKGENGNSASQLNYGYDDNRPFAGNNYYRLKQVDKDGKISYSNMVLLGRKVSGITLTSVYPNPAVRELNVVIASPGAAQVTIIVTDLSGKVVLQQKTQLVTGSNQQQLEVSALSSGTYIIRAVCADGCETAVHRFVKQ